MRLKEIDNRIATEAFGWEKAPSDEEPYDYVTPDKRAIMFFSPSAIYQDAIMTADTFGKTFPKYFVRIDFTKQYYFVSICENNSLYAEIIVEKSKSLCTAVTNSIIRFLDLIEEGSIGK